MTSGFEFKPFVSNFSPSASMSAFGPKRILVFAMHISAFRGKADMG